jgi:hypothetical protein
LSKLFKSEQPPFWNFVHFGAQASEKSALGHGEFRLSFIFRIETEGVLWLESAATLEGAVRSPGEYLLLNQVTGNKLTI